MTTKYVLKLNTNNYEIDQFGMNPIILLWQDYVQNTLGWNDIKVQRCNWYNEENCMHADYTSSFI